MNSYKILLALLVIFILFILIKLVITTMSKKRSNKGSNKGSNKMSNKMSNKGSKNKLQRVKTVKPIVILLDMDKTIIGDISPQLEEYYIIKCINEELKSLNKKQITFNFKNFRKELNDNIIRRYLFKFLKLISGYDNIEIYVYTASDDAWAKIIIPQIEKVLGFKFNRPFFTRKHIFTRKHTIVKNKKYRKSINKIKPFLFKELKNKYNLQNIDELKNIMLFDDTKNVLLEKKYQINVPEYNYLKQVDYLRRIPNEIMKKFYIIIESRLNLEHSSTIDGFNSNYHNFLKNRYLYADINNKKFNNDNYWKFVYKIFKNNIDNTSFTKLLNLLRSINPD